MGYTISVLPRTPKLRERALRFAKEFFKDWSELAGESVELISELREGSELGYDQNPKAIGFECSANGVQGEYALCLIRFLAQRVGRKRNGLFSYRYDGEACPMREGKHDRTGCLKPIPENLKELRTLELEGRCLMITVRAEMKELYHMWEAGMGEEKTGNTNLVYVRGVLRKLRGHTVALRNVLEEMDSSDEEFDENIALLSKEIDAKEDERDARIARKRLKEIKKIVDSPKGVLQEQFEQLKKRLDRWMP